MKRTNHAQPVAIDRLRAALSLDADVSTVRQVSSARASMLRSLGVTTVGDLLTHYPYRYIDMSLVVGIRDAALGSQVTVVGTLYDVVLKQPKPRMNLVELTLVDGTETMMITCFRQPWLAEKLKAGQRVAVSGKVTFDYGFKRMTNPRIEVLLDEEGDDVGLVLPIYHATEKLPSSTIARLVANALEQTRGLDDPLPLDLRCRYRLMTRQNALELIHRPRTSEEISEAHRRLVYEELLLLQLALMRRRRDADGGSGGVAHMVDGLHMAALRDSLPFALTEEQQQAVSELLAVMAESRPAHHLLLGDVGTGKTIVAAFGMAAAADSGGQTCMMAPTEVLARQYARSLGPVLDASGISWEILTGATDEAERAAIIACCKAGTVDVLFGTQAVLEPDVTFDSLTYVVIDEQQRFGVRQREALIAKGASCDVLSLTATPIPRSLALTLYGDMTLSYLTQRPGNRAGNATIALNRDQAGLAYDTACVALSQGQQVYVICPLVGQSVQSDERKPLEDDDETLAPETILIEGEADMASSNMRAVQAHHALLRDKVFSGYQVDLLHGRMKGSEKNAVMDRFRSGETQVLVSTTVIEVGVDVPNATVMIIEDADRFGLAQLHQLRGRVGRGTVPGQVFLISNSKAPLALQRLEAMETIEDGFKLSEYDLSLRREGDILGNRQHGASTLKLVNIMRDRAVIEAAHADAAAILDADPTLSLPEHRALGREVAALLRDVQQQADQEHSKNRRIARSAERSR